MSEKPEELARKFHATYEELAPKMGYTTRVDTREFNRDSLNGQLMIAVCERVLASLEPSAEREAGFVEGTFACPICGYDKPHPHTEDEQKAYREDQMRNDDWTSAAKRLPLKSGWYLCHAVSISHDMWKGIPERHRQLSWFLWVRDFFCNQAEWISGMWAVPEVLYFDAIMKCWYLRNALGNAVPSGAESRMRVPARPKYWCEVPALSQPRANGDANG